MRVLITNLFVKGYSGSENVVQLLAEGLRRAGHQPTILAPALGEQAERLRSRGFEIVDRVAQLTVKPDVIHGQHLTPCLAAMARFPDVPAVFACHSSYFEVEAPLPHPQIREVIAVDQSCAAKCRERGVSPDRLTVVLNAVDMARFARRSALPATPRKALLLTKNQGHRQAVRAACARAGLELDELGPGIGRVVPDLEAVLGNYDIVFATARMALEAAATGCAVVVCDDRGFAGMLKSADLATWRPMNFGVGLLKQPVSAELLDAAIARYDAEDAAKVTDELRKVAGADAFVAGHVEVYRRAIERPAPEPESVALATAQWIEELTVTPPDRKWKSVARELGLFERANQPLPEAVLKDELATLGRDLTTVKATLHAMAAGVTDAPALRHLLLSTEDETAKLDAELKAINVKLDARHRPGWEIGRRLKQAFVPKSLRTRI